MRPIFRREGVLERTALWDWNDGEVERQELSGGIITVVRAILIRREFLTVTGDWKTTRNGLAFSAWLVRLFVV